MNKERSNWSSRLAYIVAVSGSAVGLGNIWKFPYIAGEYGGSAFVLFYLLCIFLVATPVMIAEAWIGRQAQRNAVSAMGILAHENSCSKAWQCIGWASLLTSVIVLSFYSVIAGWTIYYIYLAINGGFHLVTVDQVQGIFSGLSANPKLLIMGQTGILLATALIIIFGVKHGIERATKILLPLLVLLLIVIAFYSCSIGYFKQAATFLLAPDFSKVTSKSILVGLGHAFFTLSLAAGTVMTYGSYLDKRQSLIKISIYVALIDTVVALVAGFAIFPLVFAHQLPPSMGPGLIFKTLPMIFGSMPLGNVFACLFFIMLLFAALTSTISIYEPGVLYLCERHDWSRRKAVVIYGTGIWLLGLATVFSLNLAENIKLFGLTMFGLLDYLTANILMPLSGLGIALFVGYAVKKTYRQDSMSQEHAMMYRIWLFLIRTIAPLAIFIVFLHALNII